MDYVIFLGEDTTVYAPQFSEEKFAKIRPGMSKNEVVSILGEPLGKNQFPNKEYTELWRYTRSSGKGNYWFRTIAFDHDVGVQEIDSHFFSN